MKKGQKNTDRHPVLVIDDDAAQLKTIADILESEDLQPICCSTGKEAIEAIKQQELNVAILDLRLPDIEGLELLKRLKQHNAGIKVIINTGYASLESVMAAINEEVFAYVRKMGDIEELLAHVHSAFHTHLTFYNEKLERKVKKRTEDLLRANKALKKEITERKQAEKTISNQNKFLNDIIESITHPLCVINVSDYTIQLANSTAKSTNHCETSKCYAFIHNRKTPCKQKHDLCPLDIIKKTKKPTVVEHIHFGNDGEKRIFEVHGYPIFDDNGKLVQLIEYNLDITERKQAEDRLQKSEERFRNVLESIELIGLMLDVDGNITFCNDFLLDLTGWKRQEVLGKSWFEIFLPAEIKDKMKKSVFYKMIQTGEHPAHYENEIITRKGERRLIAWNNTVSYDFGGRIRDITSIGEDITERKRLEEQLFHSQKMEAIGRLAGGIAHDFNNLLTVILGNTEFGLQDSNPGDPVQLDLISIEKAATEASDLVRQLLTFSRSQAHKPKIVSLNKIILNHVKMLRRIIGEDMALNTNLVKELSPIWADSGQIQRILMNLSVNARDAMPKGGELIIETKNFVADDNFYYELTQAGTQPISKNESNNYVEVTIIDNGRGMDKETLNRIFDPFYTTKKVGEGTGLGLAVVYGVVKQHKGLIKVDSQLGKGTSFRIYLPTVSESPMEKLKIQKNDKIANGEGTILVVEDEEAVRNVTNRILNGFGYKVLTAKDGNDALNVFNAVGANVDLVIMDVVMPEVSGPDAYKKLRSIQPLLPVIFVTGYDVHAEIVEFEESEQEYISVLQKPYTKEILGSKIRELLNK